MGSSELSLDDPPVLSFWRERHLCTVSLARGDGRLHVTPMGVVLEPELRVAWAITDGGSVKARLARGEPQVAVCQVDGARWSTLYGTATVETDPEVVHYAVARYADRYRVPRVNPDRVALRIAVDRVCGRV